MKGLTTAKAIQAQLARMQLPDLPRPAIPDTHPNEELVIGGTRVYSYALLAHLRELLRGVLLLNDERDAVGVYALARQLLEWTAHACYVSRNLKNFVTRSEWERAWKWLSKSIIGNLWMRQNADALQREFGEPVPPLPDPPALAAMIEAYNRYQAQTRGSSDAQQNYEFLSEFTHPNGSALLSYYEWKQNGRVLSFAAPPIRPPGCSSSLICWC